MDVNAIMEKRSAYILKFLFSALVASCCFVMQAAVGQSFVPDRCQFDSDTGCGCDALSDCSPEPSVQMPLPATKIGSGPGDGGDNSQGNVGSDGVIASRLFSGPSLFPPTDFAAYGIVAFGTRASSFNRDRHLLLCNAYVASLPHTLELEIPHADQIVTVWPMEQNGFAKWLNNAPREQVCEPAVDRYGLVIARKAINDAERTGVYLSGKGPYLLAWSPSESKGEPDALILSIDLSLVTTYEQAISVFELWRRDIEEDRTLWENGWSVEDLRLTIQQWVDKFGGGLIQILVPQ